MTHKARISPITTAALIYGVIFLGFIPPLGMAILLAAWLIQHRYRTRILNARRHAEAARAAKARSAQLEMAYRIGSL